MKLILFETILKKFGYLGLPQPRIRLEKDGFVISDDKDLFTFFQLGDFHKDLRLIVVSV